MLTEHTGSLLQQLLVSPIPKGGPIKRESILILLDKQGGVGGFIKLSDWHESAAVDCLLLPPTASLLDRIVSSKLQCDRELSKRTRISLIHRIHTAGTAYRSCFIPASGNKIIPSI